MEAVGFWALVLLLSAGAVKALSVLFPGTWDAIIDAWGEPERGR